MLHKLKSLIKAIFFMTTISLTKDGISKDYIVLHPITYMLVMTIMYGIGFLFGAIHD